MRLPRRRLATSVRLCSVAKHPFCPSCAGGSGPLYVSVTRLSENCCYIGYAAPSLDRDGLVCGGWVVREVGFVSSGQLWCWPLGDCVVGVEGLLSAVTLDTLMTSGTFTARPMGMR